MNGTRLLVECGYLWVFLVQCNLEMVPCCRFFFGNLKCWALKIFCCDTLFS